MARTHLPPCISKAALCLATLLLWVVPHSSFAHIDGFGTIPGFTSPQGFLSPEGDQIEFEWNDKNEEPTAIFKFYYKVGNGLPVDVPPEAQTEGAEIGEIEVSSEIDKMSWETTELPTGAYSLFSKTIDPPLCEVSEFLPALILIQRPGDSTPFGGLFTDPPAAGSVADRAARIKLEVSSTAQPEVTLHAGHAEIDLDAETPFSLCFEERQMLVYDFEITSNTKLDPHPTIPDRWILELIWDTQDVPEGQYILEGIVNSDNEAQALSVFSNGALNIIHLGGGSPEPEPTDDSTSPAEAGGCQSLTPSSSVGLLLLAGLFRRRQSVPYTQA